MDKNYSNYIVCPKCGSLELEWKYYKEDDRKGYIGSFLQCNDCGEENIDQDNAPTEKKVSRSKIQNNHILWGISI